MNSTTYEILMTVRRLIFAYGVLNVFPPKYGTGKCRTILTIGMVVLTAALKLVLPDYTGVSWIALYYLYFFVLFPMQSRIKLKTYWIFQLFLNPLYGLIYYFLRAMLTTDAAGTEAAVFLAALVLWTVFYLHVAHRQPRPFSFSIPELLFLAACLLTVFLYSFQDLLLKLPPIQLTELPGPVYLNFFFIAVPILAWIIGYLYIIDRSYRQKNHRLSRQEKELQKLETRLQQQTDSISKARHDQINLTASILYLVQTGNTAAALDLTERVLQTKTNDEHSYP